MTRDQIAALVRRVHFSEVGSCALRNMIGAHVLHKLGYAPRIRVGAMLYRAGSHPLRDTIAFCGPANTACFRTGFLGHVWLEVADDLIDFSVGDWRAINEYPEDDDGHNKLGLVKFKTELPDYFWRPVSSFPQWQATGEPKIGEAWYGPMDADDADDARDMILWAGKATQNIADLLTRVVKYNTVPA